MSDRLRDLTCAEADWSGLDVVVAGAGVSGFAAADTLVQRGARVSVVDGRADLGDRGELLRILGVELHLGEDAARRLPHRPDLVVTSPGWRPPPRPAYRCGARSSSPGGCAAGRVPRRG